MTPARPVRTSRRFGQPHDHQSTAPLPSPARPIRSAPWNHVQNSPTERHRPECATTHRTIGRIWRPSPIRCCRTDRPLGARRKSSSCARTTTPCYAAEAHPSRSSKRRVHGSSSGSTEVAGCHAVTGVLQRHRTACSGREHWGRGRGATQGRCMALDGRGRIGKTVGRAAPAAAA